MGYSIAGFEVTGVDIKKQKRYPFEFIQADVLDIFKDKDFLASFDAITAIPPMYTLHLGNQLREQLT